MPKSLLKESWTKALGNTRGYRAWKREGGVGLVTALLTWYFLPEQDAMTEAKIIGLAFLAAIAIVPLLEFLWNLIKSPYQVLIDRNNALEEEISLIKRVDNFNIKGKKISGTWHGKQYVIEGNTIEHSLSGASSCSQDTPESYRIDRVDLACPPNVIAKVGYKILENLVYFIRQADTKDNIEIFGSGEIDVPVNEYAEIELVFSRWIDASNKKERTKFENEVIIIELGWREQKL